MFSLGLGEGRATATPSERWQTRKLYNGGAAKRRRFFTVPLTKVRTGRTSNPRLSFSNDSRMNAFCHISLTCPLTAPYVLPRLVFLTCALNAPSLPPVPHPFDPPFFPPHDAFPYLVLLTCAPSHTAVLTGFVPPSLVSAAFSPPSRPNTLTYPSRPALTHPLVPASLCNRHVHARTLPLSRTCYFGTTRTRFHRKSGTSASSFAPGRVIYSFLKADKSTPSQIF